MYLDTNRSGHWRRARAFRSAATGVARGRPASLAALASVGGGRVRAGRQRGRRATDRLLRRATVYSRVLPRAHGVDEYRHDHHPRGLASRSRR